MSRTFPRIKDYDGLPSTSAPANLGCTYCHNDNGRTDKMLPALTHFQGRTSFHPVGYNFNGAGSDTFNEYLSTVGSATNQELDCVDCHDLVNEADGQDDKATTGVDEGTDGNPATSKGGPTGKYPEHGAPVHPLTNPYMLKNVTAANEYDPLCRDCHVSNVPKTVKGVSMQLTAHADGATGRPLVEADATAMRTADLNGDGVADTTGLAMTAQCTVCHDTHYSSNRRLFNDGHEQHKTGTGMVADTVVTSGDCTSFCHYAGDEKNIGVGGNYYQHGHGMAQSTYKYKNGKPDASGTTVTMGYNCTICHVGIDPSQKSHADKSPTGSIQDQYVKRFNLSGTMQTGDTGSAMGNPLVGICLSCHQSYEEHKTVSAGGIGCQDCHDEHAEGSGVSSNVMMIPEKSKKLGSYVPASAAFAAKAGTESVIYDSTKWDTSTSPYTARPATAQDFFRQGDANGVCDVAECHSQTGKNYAPLNTWINNAATTHKGGQQTPGTDCNSCHQHSGDSLGGWRAQDSCNNCHTANGRSHLGTTKSQATHNAHIASGYITNCADCHPHDGKSIPPGTAPHGVGGVVNFGGLRMTSAFDYSDSFNTEASCNAVANSCHNNSGGAGRWNATTLSSCADCHAAAGKTLYTTLGLSGYPPTSQKHTKHLDNNAYVTGDSASTDDCTDCHGAGADVGGHTGHVDKAITIATAGTNVKISTYNNVAKTCTNSCHLADVAGKSWATASTLVCTDCHAGTYIGGGPNLPASGLHTGVPTITGKTHGGSFLYNGGGSTAGCDTCHTTTPSTNHIDGTLTTSWNAAPPSINFAANVGFTDGTPPTCAPSLAGCHTDQTTGVAWSRRWSASATLTDGTECANCHGGSPTDAAPTIWTAWTANAGILARPAIPGGPGALTAPHATDWDGINGEKIQTTHTACKSCHGMNSPTDAAAGYNVTQMWGAPGFHGNGSIDMNGPSADSNSGNNATPAGAEYNGNDDASLETSDYSCTKACHQGAQNANKNMGDSGWPVKYGDYGSGSCNACHGYPPLTAADMATKGANYPDALVDTAYGGYAGGGDAHNAPDHIATTVTAAGGWTPCLPCHPSTSHMTTTSVLRANITVSFPAAYNAKSGSASFTPGAGPTLATCSNVSCHGGQVTPVWSGGTLNIATDAGCRSCHVAEAVASQAAATQWNSAWSGLHARAGSVSLENHTAADASVGDITDSNACTQCHGLPALHFSGLDTTATDALTDADFVTTYDGTGGNISAATGCKVTCHSDTSGSTPRWARKWSATITATDGTECANCHGSWTDGWVTGVSHRTDAGPSNQHGTTVTYPQRGCNECHGIGDAGYVFSPKWNNGSTGNHGNESIELNNNSSANPLRLTGADAGETGCSGCHLANDGYTAGQHGFPTVTRWGFATLTNGPYTGCTGCHGTNGSNIYPDGGAQNGPGYENRAGAHQKHVTAIANARGVGTADASTCDTCHPNPGSGSHHQPGEGTGDYANAADLWNDGSGAWNTGSYGSMTASGVDSDGAYNHTLKTCSNINCHAGVTTPSWYYTPDTAAPSWTPTYPNSGIAATNPNQGGVLNVTWNAATDAYPSNPVTYDLYRSTTNSAAAVFAGPAVATDLVGTSATVTGLFDGTLYYFGVRAKDNWPVKNTTANTDVSAGVAPGPAAPPTATVYYLTSPTSTTNLWGAVNTNLSLTCGTSTPNLPVSTAPIWATMPSPAAPPAGRGLLTTAKKCGTASINHWIASDATAWAYQWRAFGGFYSAPYANTTVVTGSATGNTFGFQGSTTYAPWDQVLVILAAVDSSGNHTADTSRYVVRNGLTNVMAPYSLDLSNLAMTVPAGSRLAVLFYYYDYYVGEGNHKIAYDNYTGIANQITLNETVVDTFAPTWSGGVSGIAVQDAGADGVLRVSWNSATDPGPATTPPVLYDLYRVQNAACTGLWDSLNLYRSSLGAASFQDTGLANGLTYCYGVRAKDSANPRNFTSNDAQTATASPSRGAAFGCNSCHASPPTSAGNAGSHAAHANNDADYTECNNCHPGTTSYTNSHQDGKGQLAFDGTAATAVYNGTILTYSDPSTIYSDTDGYGILTGSTGDGIDNGTCYGTPANYCHGSATPKWGTAATATCASCHNGGGGTLAPTVTMSSSHITAPGGTASCKDCHAGHFRGVRIPLPPSSWSNPNLSTTNMQSQLGIGYTNAGGIDLGGPGTVASINARATEAEICWGCHDAVATPVSEWGFNTKTTPAGYPVTTFATADGNLETENHGWIYTSASYTTKTSDWTQGFWMSPYDSNLKKRIASVHTANFDPAGQSSSVASNVRGDGTVNRTSPTLENKGAIRCSYCHDVHNLNKAAGDTQTGKPYLRGAWVGDPYPPELPPRSGYSYTTSIQTSTGATTPRATISARDKGGYFIDQNSNWPTKNAAMDTLAETAGLCTLCHGTNVDAMDYYAGSKLWLPGMTNGHSNSALGGTGANKKDIFTASRYGCGMGMQLCTGGCNDPNYPLIPGGDTYWCQGNGDSCGSCQVIAGSGWYGTDAANWYGVGTIGGAEGAGTMAHQYTCSKCHRPHASGLPALLPQNCIDPAQGDYTINGQSGVNVVANNCHRKTSKSDGWHILAPGQ